MFFHSLESISLNLQLYISFRPGSVGELYTYLPLTPDNAKRLMSVPPLSVENGDCGFSVGRGAFHLGVAIGRWVTVAFRIKLNNIGSSNGCSYFCELGVIHRH